MTNNSMQSFAFEGNQFRNVGDSDAVEIVASDVAKILGYSSAKDMARTLDDDEKGTREVPTLGGVQKMTVITEGGLFKAILQREVAYVKDPESKAFVKRFQHWVTHEVLPSIRRHGAYATPATIDNILADPDNGIRLLEALKAEREAKQAAQMQLEAQRPKVVFADAVETGKRSILVGELAKILKQNGYNIGQNRFFARLREDGLLMKRNGMANMPTQKAMNLGLFEVKETPIQHADHSTLSFTTKVTPRGQIYLINKYLGQSMGETA